MSAPGLYDTTAAGAIFLEDQNSRSVDLAIREKRIE
jgi:hypothetical protein